MMLLEPPQQTRGQSLYAKLLSRMVAFLALELVAVLSEPAESFAVTHFCVRSLTPRPETVRQHPTRCLGDCQHQDLRLQPTVANARRGARRMFDAEALCLRCCTV